MQRWRDGNEEHMTGGQKCLSAPFVLFVENVEAPHLPWYWHYKHLTATMIYTYSIASSLHLILNTNMSYQVSALLSLRYSGLFGPRSCT